MQPRERFVRLWAAAQPLVSAWLLSRTGSHALTDDLEQETAMAAWLAFADYDGERSFGAWVLGIAKNKWREHCRREPSHIGLPVPVLDDADEDLQDPEWIRHQAELLAGCLARLEPEQRELLRRRYELGEKAPVIAGALGSTANNIRVVLHRVKARLRKCIRDRLRNDGADARRKP